SLKYEHQSASNNVDILQTRLETFKELSGIEDVIAQSSENQERFAALKELQIGYKVAYQTLNNATFTNNNAYEDLETAESELQKAWDEAGGVCPLCEQAHGQGVCN